MTDIVSYYIHDATGAITLSGKCYSDQVPVAGTGKTLVVGHPVNDLQPIPGKHKIDISTGAIVALPPPVVVPTLNRTGKNKELDEACSNAITGGFRSNALGSMYSYPSKIIDQLNMLHGGSLVCCDTNNVWAARDHTDPQLQQVRAAFRALRDGARTKLNLLLLRVAAATTQPEIDAIGWKTK